MADEAVPIYGTKNSAFTRQFTIANNPAIPLHTLMFLSDDCTASFSAGGSGAIFAGISITAKEAGDGQTEMSLDNGGVWDLTCSGSVTKGNFVVMAGGNRVGNCDWLTPSSGAVLTSSGGLIVGMAQEAGTNGEQIRVDLNRR